MTKCLILLRLDLEGQQLLEAKQPPEEGTRDIIMQVLFDSESLTQGNLDILICKALIVQNIAILSVGGTRTLEQRMKRKVSSLILTNRVMRK